MPNSTYRYEPESEDRTLSNTKVCLKPSLFKITPSVVSVILELLEADCQVTLGVGVPFAIQVTLKFFPSVTVWFKG